MFQIKQKSKSNEYLNVETKKFRTFNGENISITRIEHLSNEFFYEIYKYLDGYDIYTAFFNLNYRFQYLIKCSSFLFKIKFYSNTKSKIEDCCKSLITPNRHQILSLCFEDGLLIDYFFTHCLINSSFNRLESIVVNHISPSTSMILLFYLKSLPCLYSLTMNIDIEWGCDLSNIYRMIFNLSSLKYNKLSLFLIYGDEDIDISMPLAINEQFSTIEYLVINHICTINELMSILCHTPQLRHLTCSNLIESDNIINVTQLMTLSNLVYIHIDSFCIEFDKFEMLMTKISCQLEVLHIIQGFGKAYLDANRWEKLIINHMPHLHVFNYEYRKYNYDDYENISLDMIINQFTSPFWVNRQWIFQLEIHNKQMSLSIHPLWKIFFDFPEYEENTIYSYRTITKKSTKDFNIFDRTTTDSTSIQFNSIIQLTVTDNSFDEQNLSFIDRFKSIFIAIYFTRLNINCKNIPIGLLIRIIQLLPNLDSLKITSLPNTHSDCLIDNDEEIRYLVCINNKITKVNIEKIIDIEQIYFLLYLCLRIQYFQITVSENIDLEMLVRIILIESNIYTPYLKSLCLCIPNIDDTIVYQLKKLIDTEKLLTDYTTKRICNNILFKWNSSMM